MVEEPGSRLSALDILGEPVRQQVLEHFNETSVEHPSPALIHELFEEQVRRDPQGVAVVYGQQEWTYGELNERANRLAHYLRGRGVQPDARVGLCVERGLGMVVGLLGILKSGAAYVPLDPAYPRDRLQYMLEDAAPQVVLTQERLKELLPAGQPGQAELVTLDGDWERIEAGARESAQNLPAASIGVRPEHLAYVIYTSGSTGRPKGVMVTHAGVVNFLHSMQRSPGIESTDRLLAVTTLSFDIAGLEIYLPLISGAQVVVLDRETAVDAPRLIQSIEQYRPTILQATPSTWRMLLSAGWSGSAHLKVLCGGEALTSELAGQLLPRVGQLWNVYGPTETTIWSCLRQVRSVGAQAVESIGKPIENTQVYLLDEARQPVPVGVVGHIYIAGSGLARGYLNRPELTAERFIEIPFASGRDASPGSRERMYATGDLGRWQPDGNIEYLGRNDHQVKIRGFRIEVGEVQHTVESLPCVRECLVDAAADEAGERRLIAYIVPENGEPESAESYTAVTDQIVAGLRARLPDYMLPSAYVYLQSMPLTPNGKVDRAQLSSHRIDGQSRAYLAPRSEIEARLCEMWKDFLKVERVGVRDDFFLLGGHSLLAARLVSAMRSEFAADDGDVSIAAFFAARTVEKIAEYLEAKALAKKLSGRKRELASAGASVEEGTL
jgi:amino acid adenylation domain-containing protein